VCSECLLRGRECIFREPKKKGRIRGGKNKKKKPDNNDGAVDSSNTMSQSMNTVGISSLGVGSNVTSSTAMVEREPSSSLNRQKLNLHRKEPYPIVSNSSDDALKKHLSNLIPNGVNSLISENYSLYKQFLKRNTIDSYYNIVSGGHPVVGRKVFEDFLFNMNNYHNNKELMALVFSIQALCEQRFGRRDRAIEDVNISKQLLSSLFDKWDDFFVVSTYNYLSYFFAGEGDDSRARFYLNNVDHYFREKNLIDHDSFTPEMKNLDKMIAVAKLSIDSQNYHSVEDEHFMCNRLSLLYRYATGRPMPEEYMSIARQKITPQNVISYLGLLDTVCSFLRLHNQTFSVTPEQREMATITDSMVYHGSRMKILIEAGIRGSLIEISANKIIDETTKETFPVIPVALAGVVAGACKVHLSIIRMIGIGKRENMTDGIDYYEYVAKGLRALNILATRYGRVSKFCGIIMKEQQEVIEGKYSNVINSIEELTNRITKRQSIPISDEFGTYTNIIGNTQPQYQPPRFEELSSSSSSSSSPQTSSSSSNDGQAQPVIPGPGPFTDPSVSELLSQIYSALSQQAGMKANSSAPVQNMPIFDVNNQQAFDIPISSTPFEMFPQNEEFEQILDSFEQYDQDFDNY